MAVAVGDDSKRRVAQNHAYAAFALEHLNLRDSALAWIANQARPRQKVLVELGRIADIDAESAYEMAVDLCADPPKTSRDGAERLRKLRSDSGRPTRQKRSGGCSRSRSPSSWMSSQTRPSRCSRLRSAGS